MRGGEQLARLLTRAKEEQRYYTVPWAVADYDGMLAGPDDAGHDSAPSGE
ncbi:MAG: hypothetical protein ACRDKL_00905 [Solirubrobacteraceae bacterium]